MTTTKGMCLDIPPALVEWAAQVCRKHRHPVTDAEIRWALEAAVRRGLHELYWGSINVDGSP